MNIRPVRDLLQYTFVIPPYQRGYRWDTEQINALLEDFKEFADANYNQPQIFYCLQPIVVVPDVQNTYVVVDGQQRLTTIYLILEYIKIINAKSKNITLDLPGRPTQQNFLRNRTFAEKTDITYKDNIDNFYLRKAYETIEKWFDGEDKSRYVYQFHDILITAASVTPPKAHIAVIWHEIPTYDALRSFRNLNYGKIPLTPSEIVKGLLLQSDCYPANSHDQDLARRRASEWERMVMLLSDPSLKGVFGEEDLDMIDVVLSFVADSINEREHYQMTRKKENRFNIDLFNYYVIDKYIKFGGNGSRSDAVQDVWCEIQATLNSVLNWTDNRSWYHLIGLYSLLSKEQGVALLKTMKTLCGGKTKPEFTEALIEKIGRIIKVDKAYDNEGDLLPASQQGLNSPNLNYDASPKKLIAILTAFNVMTVENDTDKTRRFPYNLFRKKKITSLEHIHPQNIQEASYEEYVEWLTQRKIDLEALKTDETAKSRDLEKALQSAAKLEEILADKNSFINRKSEVAEYTGDIDTLFGDMAAIKPEELHHIKNLALVDKDTNSALQNYFLDKKRKILIDRDKSGETYMTPATENVFSKKYSASQPGNMNFWTENDRNNYLKQLQDVYSHFIKN